MRQRGGNHSGLKIIFGQLPVILSGQTDFSSVTCRFEPVKILKIALLNWSFCCSLDSLCLRGIKTSAIFSLFLTAIFINSSGHQLSF